MLTHQNSLRRSLSTKIKLSIISAFVYFSLFGLFVIVFGATLWLTENLSSSIKYPLVTLLLIPYFHIYGVMKRYMFTLNRPRYDEFFSTATRWPVLFLRTYGNDSIPVGNVANNASVFRRATLKHSGSLSFDYWIANSIGNSIGPMLTFQSEKEIGFSEDNHKFSVDNTRWKDEIEKALDKVSCVIILTGTGDGLLWEIGTVREKKLPHCVFFVTLPSAAWKPDSDGWNRLRDFASNLSVSLPASEPGPGSVISFDHDWQPIILRQGALNPDDYVSAIRRYWLSTSIKILNDQGSVGSSEYSVGN